MDKKDLSTGFNLANNKIRFFKSFNLLLLIRIKKTYPITSISYILSACVYVGDRTTEEKMRIALLILGSLFSTCTFAGIYKCTDMNGKTNYQSKPCDPEHKTVEINVKTGSSSNNETDKEREKQELAKKEQGENLEKEQILKKQAQLKQDTMSESAKNQFLVKNNPEKFSAFSIPPYDLDQLPNLVKDYQTRLPDIERLRRQAAEKALASGQCNRVESSELDAKSIKKNLVFSISCSSGKILYFTEQELAQ